MTADLLPDGVTLRRAGPDDAEALAHLHLDVWDDAYTGLMPQSILDDRREQVAERVARWQRDPRRPTTATCSPWGRTAWSASPAPGPAATTTWTSTSSCRPLYVRKALWGTGVGYALLETAIGDRAAYLWVLAGNDRAIRFYERQGFRLDGTEDEHDEGLHVRMVRAGT